MKQSLQVVVAGLVSTSTAIQTKASPDVFGANGKDYLNTDPRVDLARIGISIQGKGHGKKCKEGDWTTVHWVGFLKDGREVTNSRSEGLGYPKTFSLGTHDVFKCWELALTKLKQGAKARVSCPYDLAWGAAYTWAPLGGAPIPLHSDVDFDLEVVECNRTPVWTK
jgi:FKBP-type peptidyl-prolyl cis-trans isomerase